MALHSPSLFLWFILLLFSPSSQSSGVAAVSWWMNMENGTNGAQLTTNILNGATVGGTTAAGAGWSVFPGPTASNMVSMQVQTSNDQPLSGPVTINGTAYSDAGSTRSFSSRNDRRSHYVKYTLPARQPRVSIGCYLRLENLTGTWGYYDLIHLDGGGYYVVLALRDAPWDPDHAYNPTNRDDLERRRAIRVHSQAPPYVGSDIPIFANKTYWVTMLWDTNPWDANPAANKKGTAILRVYDPQTWLPVGEPSVLELSDNPLTAPLKCEDIRFGRCDDHGGTSPASYHYFDDLLVDETGSKWPLLPGEISVAGLPDPTNAVAIPATLRVLPVDPEGQALDVTFYGRAAGGSPQAAFAILQTNPTVPSGSVTTAIWGGLSFSTEYEWYVTASDGSDTSVSPVWRFRTTNNTPPNVLITVPQDNTFFPVASGNILIEASAGDANGAVAKVEFLAGGTWIGEDATSPFSYLWNGVPEGVHVLTAIAQDEQGARSTSAPVTITVGGPPLAPTGLTATPQFTGEILLAWTDNSDNETGFEIDLSLDGVNYALVGTVGPNVTTGLLTNLQPATTYFFLVRAFNGAGPSGHSNPASVVTLAAPTISDIADQAIDQNTSTGPLVFTIGDVEIAAASLIVGGSSSNPALVPNEGIVFDGSDANRTVTVTPAAGQSGSSTITVTVSDGLLTASDTFLLTVNAVNTPPTISEITNQNVNEDGSTGPLAFTVGDAETAAASLTVTGSSSNPTLVPNGSIVFAGSGPNRTITVTPALEQFGTSTITVTVSDGLLTASNTFLLTVNAVNDGPTISDIANQTINQDTLAGPLAFAIGDVEMAAEDLVVSGSSSNPTLVPDTSIVFGGSGASRTVTVSPALEQFGTSTITVTVSDGSLTTSDTFVLTVNARPTISDIVDQAINEDGFTDTLAFTVGDAETAAASLAVTGFSSDPTLVPNAGIVFGGSGAIRTVTVTPAANLSGTATITVNVSDGSLTASDTFLLTVNAVNDAPTISDVANQTINQDTSTAPLTFVIGDVEMAAEDLVVSGSSSNPTLVPDSSIVFGGSGASRTVTVSPALEQFGTSTITVTVSDGSLTTSDTFVLTVNARPTISDIVDQAINEDGFTDTLAFTVGDAETAAASLTVIGFSSDPTLVPNGSIVFGGSGANRTVTVTPAANLSGTATITVSVSDGFLTTSDTFLLTVNAVNDAPTITDIANQTINQNTSAGPLAFAIGDVETAPATLTVSGSSSNPALVPNENIVFGGTGANRTVTVTPAAGQSGSATIAITVSDGGLTASDTFVLTVNAVNTPPTISDIANRTVNEDNSSGSLAFTVGDAETSPASLTVTGSSSNPALLPNASIVFGGSGANRSVTVTPAANQFGTATITVNVSDGSLTTGDTFLLTVNAVNDAPTITDIANQTINQNTSTGPLAFTVGDVETAATSLAVSGSSSNPTLVPNSRIVFGGSGANRTVTVTPAAGRTGSATITITVSDGALTASDTFVLTVNAVNTPPTISDIANRTINEDSSSGSVAFIVGDAETAAASLTVSGSSSNPTLVPNARIVFGGSGTNRTVIVTPATNQFGTATITVNVSDGSLTASDTFLLTVNAVNDAPTITDIANQTINQNTAAGPFAFTIGDVETAGASLTMSASSSNPALVPNASLVFGGSDANRTVTLTPVAGQSGSSTITITVSDGTLTASDTFLLTVNPAGSPAYLLAEGFEGTGFENTGWTKNGSANADYTTTVLAGAQSLNCSGAQFIQRSFQYSTGFNLYFRVRWNTWRSYANVIYWDNASWGTAAVLYADANRFQIIHGGASATGTTPLSANVTYHVWVEWTKGTGADGTMKLFVSTTGTKPATPEANITTGTGTATERIYVGPTGSGPNVIFDRLLVSDVPIFSNP